MHLSIAHPTVHSTSFIGSIHSSAVHWTTPNEAKSATDKTTMLAPGPQHRQNSVTTSIQLRRLINTFVFTVVVDS
jgi:hypothetical protein